MTTICANREFMAADSKCSYGGTSFETRKLERVGDAIVGTAGDAACGSKFVRWLREARNAPGDEIPDPPKFAKDDDWDALVLTPAGLFLYAGTCEPVEITSGKYAIGSGAQAALAGLAMGLSPERAVLLACQVDEASGDPVIIESL